MSTTVARTDCQSGGGEAGQPLGTGVFGLFSLKRNRAEALHWQPAFFWREIILERLSMTFTPFFLAGNHIREVKHDVYAKRQKSE